MTCFFRRFGALVAASLALTAAATAQPANDDCANAQDVTEGEFFFDLAGASNSRQSSCDDPNAGAVPDVWFRYTAIANGTALVSTCGLVQSIFGTTLTAYNNNCNGGEVACNSNACGEGQSTVSFNVVGGHSYLVRLASSDTRTPNGSVRFTLIQHCNNPPPGAPANDCCATATPAGNGTFAFTTIGATRDYAGACDQNNPNPDVWFDYTAPTTWYSKVRPAPDAPQDLGVTILDGTCTGIQIACGGDFMWEGDTRQVVFPTVAGHHYLVRLHGVSDPNASGHIVFATATPPANDECVTAAALTGLGTFAYDNTLANNSGPANGLSCDAFGGMDIAHDVWFRWTSNLPAGQDAVISTCNGTRVDTKIAVYADGCPVGQPLDCNDDFCFLQSQVAFTPTPGAAYIIRIGNWPGFENEPAPDGKPGTFTVSARPTCTLMPPAGAIIEAEACGQNINDGFDENCNGLFTDLPSSNVTIYGHAPVLAAGPDLDMYRMTFTQATRVVFSGTAEFPMILAILDTQCPQNRQVGWVFPSQPCDDPSLNPLDIVLDAGTYAFAVANRRAFSDCSGKNAYIVSITVEACVAPSITMQPASQAACRGSASFIVGASGTGPLFYQWQFNGAPIFDDPPHITGAFDSTLTITGVTEADLGTYTATVNGGCGQATSNDAVLTAGCYANCDCSAASPVLNVADFTCFLQKFAAHEDYANCDQSTTPPVLNVQDFSCFLQKFAAGCH